MNDPAAFQNFINSGGPLLIGAFVLLFLWAYVWKAIALWRSGRNNQLVWFIVLFLLNTVGILEIIYLLFFQKEKAASK